MVIVKKLAILLLSASMSASLLGCVTTGGSNEATGTQVGAISGAMLGGLIANNSNSNPLVGALIGGAVGAMIGNRIGAALDAQERRALAAATERAMTARANRRIAWSAPKTSSKKRVASTSSSSKTKTPAKQEKPASGYVIPGEIYTKSDGQQCRKIEQVAYKNDKVLKDSTTACKTGSGWKAAAV